MRLWNRPTRVKATGVRKALGQSRHTTLSCAAAAAVEEIESRGHFAVEHLEARTLFAAAPDLTSSASSITVSSSSVSPGNAINVNYPLQDNGGAAPQSQTKLTLVNPSNVSQVFSSTTYNEAAIAANSSSPRSGTIAAPTTPGTYQLRLILDNLGNIGQVVTNNDIIGGPIITVTAPVVAPDLTSSASSINVSPSSVSPGGTINVNYPLQDLGGAAPQSQTKLTLVNPSNVSQVFSSTTYNEAAIAANSSSPRSGTIAAPTTPGTYQLRLILDNLSNIGQVVTNNDIIGGPIITVTAPVVAPDLTSSASSINVSPSSVSPGGTINVNYPLQDLGGAAPQSQTKLTLVNPSNVSQVFSSTTYNEAAIAANSSSPRSGTIAAPTTPGTYQLRLILDNLSNIGQVVTNNDIIGGPIITVTAGASVNVSYDRNAAVAYARKYANCVVSDGYFWTDPSTSNFYGAGQPAPTGTGLDGGIGDDCAHFVSSCIGSESHEGGGGLAVPNTTGLGAYGDPSASHLAQWLLSNYATEATSVSALSAGDVIAYDWTGDGHIDHIAIYLGGGNIAAHAASKLDAAWDVYKSASPNFVAHFIHINSDTTPTPSPASWSASATVPSLQAGSVANISVKLTTAQQWSNGVADWEIFDQSGKKMLQTFFLNQNLSAGQTVTYTVPWTPAAAGTYTMKMGVFTGDWNTCFYWSENVTTLTVAPAAPIPAAWSASATVPSLQAGSVANISVKLTTAQQLSNGVADWEIFDQSGKKMLQTFFLNQNLSAGQTVTYTVPWTPAAAGTYTMKMGVFTGDWNTCFYWSENVTTLTVAPAAPIPAAWSASATVPSLQAGSVANISVKLTTAQQLSNGVADWEIFDQSGKKMLQTFFLNQNLSAGQTVTYTVPWTPAAAGTYTMKMGVFTGDWNTCFYWSENVTTLTVAPAATPAPAKAGTTGTSSDGHLYTVYTDSVRVDGSRSWRNSNPGNIVAGTFAASYGAYAQIGSERFAVFPSEAAGMSALKGLLSGPAYNSLTIQLAINKWTPPSENNSAAYVAFITSTTGLSADRLISSMSDAELTSMADAMRVHEGWTAGTIYNRGDPMAPNWVKQLLGY